VREVRCRIGAQETFRRLWLFTPSYTALPRKSPSEKRASALYNPQRSFRFRSVLFVAILTG
jgi:hypothetical protein